MVNVKGKVLSDDLFNFCVDVLTKLGVYKRDSEVVSEHLVLANLRGVDSHGAFVRIPHYVSALRQGVINPKPKIKKVKEYANAGLIDGDGGFGPVVAMMATELAINKAKKSSVCIIGSTNMSHVGMLARYTLKATESRMVGMAATSSPVMVVPWGGRKPVLGTNPFSIGFPVNDGNSIIVDMATSSVSGGKIAVLASKGEKMPEGWALDKYGNPITDPKVFLDGGILLPFGGYKGFGLCLSVEIFSSILTGAPYSVYIKSGWATQGGFIVEVIDVSSFRPYEEYQKDMVDLIKIIKTTPPAEGFKEVLLPGELEKREYDKRIIEGIPVYEDSWEKVKGVADELGVSMPILR
ncbi:MAG: Ldh family oxidoreductase [Nitrososphaeria archaeon]